MTIKVLSFAVLLGCLFCVLNPRLHTRTVGTATLSFIGILALVNFL